MASSEKPQGGLNVGSSVRVERGWASFLPGLFMVYPCGQKVIQPLLLDISNDEELTPQGRQLYFKTTLRVRRHALY